MFPFTLTRYSKLREDMSSTYSPSCHCQLQTYLPCRQLHLFSFCSLTKKNYLLPKANIPTNALDPICFCCLQILSSFNHLFFPLSFSHSACSISPLQWFFPIPHKHAPKSLNLKRRERSNLYISFICLPPPILSLQSFCLKH